MTEHHDHRDDCPFKFATLDVCDCVEKNMLGRIEALTEQLAAARQDAEEAEAYAGELEVNLAKAVEALKDMCLEFRQADLPYGSAAYAKARATFAEIKGESHE